MSTVLWTCGTLKRVKFSRDATVVPLLSLKMGVLSGFEVFSGKRPLVDVRKGELLPLFNIDASCLQSCEPVAP